MAAGTRPASQRFRALDALRGLAAMGVAVFHFYNGWAGYLAVDFFLVLSGFVLSHRYLRGAGVTSMPAFIGQRLARLYPLHLFTLATVTAAIVIIGDPLPQSPDGRLFILLQNLTLTQNIGFSPGGGSWNFPAWSVSVELWVNILFFLFATRLRSGAMFFIALAGFLVLFNRNGYLDINVPNYYDVVNTGLLRGLSSFLLGVLSYRAFQRLQDHSAVGRWPSPLEVLCLGGVAVAVFARSFRHSSMDFVAPFVFMATVTVFAFERGLVSRILTRLTGLGDISYSVYLNQFTVLILTRPLIQGLGFTGLRGFLVYLGVLLPYSILTYHWVEKPAQRFGRSVTAALTGPQA